MLVCELRIRWPIGFCCCGGAGLAKDRAPTIATSSPGSLESFLQILSAIKPKLIWQSFGFRLRTIRDQGSRPLSWSWPSHSVKPFRNFSQLSQIAQSL
jgi:hypothetical protein